MLLADKNLLFRSRTIEKFLLCVKQNLNVPPEAGLWLQLGGLKRGPVLSKGVNIDTVPRGLIMQEGQETE